MKLSTTADVNIFVKSFTAPAVNRHARTTYKVLLDALDNPERSTKTLHITGTNGKGSTTAMLYSGLLAAGYRTSAYLSPDVFDFRERWQVNGDLVSEIDLVTAARELSTKLMDIDPSNTDLTEFEVKTLLAFLIARRCEVDYHCIEVGIGGKFDATNVIPAPVAAVITSIGLDHADVLGESIRDVAYHKVGIVKAGTGTLGIGNVEGEAREIILERATHLELQTVAPTRLGSHFIAIPGQHMATNAGLALAVLQRVLPAETDFATVTNAICRTTMPGRMQAIVVNGRCLLFDGAHNGPAAKQLAMTLAGIHGNQTRIHAVVAHTGTHDGISFANALAPVLDSVIVTTIHERGQPSDTVADAYLQAGIPVAVVREPAEAIKHAIDGAGIDEIILVTGSFYLATAIKQFLPSGYSPAITSENGYVNIIGGKVIVHP